MATTWIINCFGKFLFTKLVAETINQTYTKPLLTILKNLTKIYFGITLIFVIQLSFGQNRMIKGKVIDQNLIEFPGVLIMSPESKVIDTTDFNGDFEFKYTNDIKTIKFVSILMQEEEIEITPNCNYIELILLDEWIYDYVSVKRANRKKERDRKRLLPKLYEEAYQKGIFKNKKL